MIWGNSGVRTLHAAVIAVVISAVLVATLAATEGPAHAAPPANDDFADAEVIAGLPVTASGSTVDATVETGEPAKNLGAWDTSVWFDWTASGDGPVAINLTASTLSTEMEVYTGPDVAHLTNVVSTRKYWDKGARLGFDAEAGVTYRIVVDSEASAGPFEIQVERAAAITGTVTSTQGEGVDSVAVIACVWVGDECDGTVSSRTDESGSFSVAGLEAGDYKVRFRPRSGGVYLHEWYDDQDDAASGAVVSVADASVVEGIDAVLATKASLGGVVTDPSGDGLQGVAVQVCRWDADGQYCKQDPTTLTDEDGRWSIDMLLPGEYKIGFLPSRYDSEWGDIYLDEWYQNQPSREAAESVTVSKGDSMLSVNAELARPGSVSGQVTGRDTGPLADVDVELCLVGADETTCDDWPYPSTGSDGRYTISGLLPGEYTIRFVPPRDHHAEWYDDAGHARDATTVRVTNGSVTRADAVLDPLGSIRGTVTDSDGQGIEGVEVGASHWNCEMAPGPGYPCSSPFGDGVVTDASGDYVLRGLSGGNYRVLFRSTEYRAETTNFIDVGSREAITGIDVTLYTDEDLEPAPPPEPTYRCKGKVATIVGTDGDDVLVGTNGPDVIHGRYGEDVIRGRGGDDVICGGEDDGATIRGGWGDDTIISGDYDDLLVGGPGSDVIKAGGGDDEVRGNRGSDRLFGGGQSDRVLGGDGHDLVVGNGGWDRLYGDRGRDRVVGGGGQDRMEGGNGHDVLVGGRNHDYLRGKGGRDTLKGKGGRDDLLGGRGWDKCRGGPGRDEARACEFRRGLP